MGEQIRPFESQSVRATSQEFQGESPPGWNRLEEFTVEGKVVLRYGTAGQWTVAGKWPGKNIDQLRWALKQYRTTYPESLPGKFRFQGNDVCVWSEDQVDAAIAYQESNHRLAYKEDWKSEQIVPDRRGTVLDWSKEFGWYRSLYTKALDTIGANSLERKTVRTYTRHAAEAAAYHLESLSLGNDELAYDPEGGEVKGSTKVWSELTGFAKVTVQKLCRENEAEPHDTVGAKGGNPARIYSEPTLRAIAPSLIDQPQWQTDSSEGFQHPETNTLYMKVSSQVLEQIQKTTPKAVLVVRGIRHPAIPYVELSAYAARSRKTVQEIYQGVKYWGTASPNPANARIEQALQLLHQEADACVQAGVVQLSSEGTATIDGRDCVPRSVIARHAEIELGIHMPEQRRLLFSKLVPYCRRRVTWQGEWEQPVFMPLFDYQRAVELIALLRIGRLRLKGFWAEEQPTTIAAYLIEKPTSEVTVQVLKPTERGSYSVSRVLDTVAEFYGITRPELLNAYEHSQVDVVRAKKVTMYILLERLHLTYHEVACALNDARGMHYIQNRYNLINDNKAEREQIRHHMEQILGILAADQPTQ